MMAGQYKQLQQLMDTWVLAEARADEMRQTAIDAAIAAHDPSQSMSLRHRQECKRKATAHSGELSQHQTVRVD